MSLFKKKLLKLESEITGYLKIDCKVVLNPEQLKWHRLSYKSISLGIVTTDFPYCSEESVGIKITGELLKSLENINWIIERELGFKYSESLYFKTHKYPSKVFFENAFLNIGDEFTALKMIYVG